MNTHYTTNIYIETEEHTMNRRKKIKRRNENEKQTTTVCSPAIQMSHILVLHGVSL